MKKDFLVIVSLLIIGAIFYRNSFFTFFAQDDFILINHFSQNNFWQDIKNVFGFPTVTHWRPLHNLYFLISGNLFERNYISYHLVTFALHVAGSFLIFKVAQKLIRDLRLAFAAALLYAVHPAHFVSLFWISGGATVIGFFFLTASLYSFLLNKRPLAAILYILALLSSEAMIVGLVLFYCFKTLKQRLFNFDKFLAGITIISFVFGLMKLALTPRVTFDIYQLKFSFQNLVAIRYYLLRIFGFAEVSDDFWLSMLLLAWLALILVLIVKIVKEKKQVNQLLFSISIIFTGLFPFILIPGHLSPHYMNIAIFGFSILIALSIASLSRGPSLGLFMIFVMVAFYNIQMTINNNWVIKRSNLAKFYIQKIDQEKPAFGSTIVFDDNDRVSSQEAYFALGGKEAIKFWFANNNYKTCFSAFENCSSLP